ncbi:MAG: hypothetical protein J7L34_03525 [Thermotogaceae bacterium]|nr:hypothetical protein [Thermotogaceae bacterium]
MKIAVYTGKGSAKESAKSIIRISSKVGEVVEFDKNIPNSDVYIIGGGLASEIAANLGMGNLKKLESIILNDRKRYIGICAGAYLAIEGYWTDKTLTNYFVLIKAKHPDIDNWRRGQGWIKVEVREEEIKMWYENGPLFEGNGFEIIGRFLEDINETDSDYSMKNTPAIIKKDNIVLFSPHSELSGEVGEKLLLKALEGSL